MVITSVKNERIKELVKLKDKKYRDKMGLFFIEGLDIIDEAYKSGVLKCIYVLDGYDNPYRDIPCIYVSYDVMKKISDMESISEYYGVCERIDNDIVGDRVIILDGIQDPGNLGTIIRSAVAFNFDTVVISKNSVSIYNPKVLRSTKGMIFNINIVVCELDSFMDKMDDYLIYGTDVVSGIDVREMEVSKKMAIVIGNEGSGISKEVHDKCDKFLYIDMNDKCESLNAGVAASIIMYEVNRR